MKREVLLTTILTLAMPFALLAEGEPSSPVSKSSQRLEILAKHVALQEERVEAITLEMLEIDRDIERRVSRVVDRLASIKDSQDSDTKVVNQKRKIIEGLAKSIETYKRERDKRKAQVVRPTYLNVGSDALAKDVKVLDEHMEKRIEQILQLTASLAEHKDYDRYDNYRSSYYDNNGYNRSRNEKYKKNQRVNIHATNLSDDVSEGLKKSIEKLKRENVQLELKLKQTRDPAAIAFYKDRIAWNKELIQKRDEQAWNAPQKKSPASRTVSRKEANQLDNMIDDERLDIRADHRHLVALRSKRDTERARLKRVKTQLAQEQRKVSRASSP